MLTVETDADRGRGTAAFGRVGVSGVRGRAGGVGPGPGSDGPRPGRRGVGRAAAVAVHRLPGDACAAAGAGAGPARGHRRGDRGGARGEGGRGRASADRRAAGAAGGDGAGLVAAVRRPGRGGAGGVHRGGVGRWRRIRCCPSRPGRRGRMRWPRSPRAARGGRRPGSWLGGVPVWEVAVSGVRRPAAGAGLARPDRLEWINTSCP